MSERARRFVEDHDIRVGDECPSNREALALPTGELATPFTDRCGVTERPCRNLGMQVRALRR